MHASEVLDYYSFGTPTQESVKDESIYVTDFPTLKPPFETFFVEHGRTGGRTGFSKGNRTLIDEFQWETGLWLYGCLVDCLDLWNEGTNLSLGPRVRELVYWHCGEEALSPQLRWLVCIYLFAASPLDKRVKGFLKGWGLPIRQDGSILYDMSGSKGAVLTKQYHPDADATRIARVEYDGTTVRSYLLPTLFAISAMNSPHMRMVTTTSSAGTIHDLRATRLIKILDIAGKTQEFGVQRALHTCSRYFVRRHREYATHPRSI